MGKDCFMVLFAKVGLFICCVVCFTSAKADIHLSSLFGDHMVLQRDKPCAIWGSAEKGEKIAVAFDKHNYNTTADKTGKWKIMFPPQSAGGPYDITLKGRNQLTLHNVLFGDVWICGGQSNMQFHVYELAHKEADSALDNNAGIRIFTAGITTNYVPQDTLKGGSWQVASVESIQNFSAVAFFFGRYVQEHIGVPIGLISDNLGATSAEEWMSKEAIHKFPQFDTYYNQYLAPGKSFAQLNAEFEKKKAVFRSSIYNNDDPGVKDKWYLNNTDTSSWKEMNLPAYWEDAGLPGYDGSVWFKRTFDLPETYNHKSLHIGLGEIDDYDDVWINGVKAGEGYGNLNLRDYEAPDSILQPKNNVITLRVFDKGNKGGLYNLFWFADWRGRWLYKPGLKLAAPLKETPTVVNANVFGSPSVLYDGNIAPLTQLAIKGAIWYQGEANAGRAYEYQTLFPAMITDWRNQFKQGDFPFLFVQLANWRDEDNQPQNSDWAELREAQAMTLSLPNTGMASAIDIGEAADIHPKNKMEVGKRLALAALKVAYDKGSTHTHPVFESMRKDMDSIVITVSDRVVSNDKYGYIRGFAIAGKDSVFHWANAYARGRQVVVYSRDVMQPVAVRYAWGNNPGTLNLYNKEGLPLVPFRTDDRKGMTAESKFEFVE